MANENDKYLIGEFTNHLIDVKASLKGIENVLNDVKELKIKIDNVEKTNKQILDELEAVGEILEDMVTENENETEPENKVQTFGEKALALAERNPDVAIKLINGLGLADKIGPILQSFVPKGDK